MAKKKPATVTVRRNGVTRKLHGAAAAAVLRARAAREKKKKPNGIGSTIKTVVSALHEGARGVAKATISNGGNARTWYVDAYRGKQLIHQGVTTATSKADALQKARKAYREAGDNPRKYRFVAYPEKSNPTQPDAAHPNLVHRYFRGGGKSMRQRATEAGQKWLFENPAHGRMKTRKRRNPDGAPAQIETLFEDFQGRPVEGYDLAEAPEWTPNDVAVLGGLAKLHLKGGEKVEFDPTQVLLCADKNGELIIVGARFDFTGELPDGPGTYEVIEAPAYFPSDAVLIDEITKIEYDTHKDHIGDGEEYRFVHKFGEEGGERPFLALDADGFPMIIGGDWYITREGIRD
jgi:hypothetical protein